MYEKKVNARRMHNNENERIKIYIYIYPDKFKSEFY